MYPNKSNPYYGTFVEKTTRGLESNGGEVTLAVISSLEKNFFYKIINYLSLYCRVIFLLLSNRFDYVYIHFPSHTFLPVYMISFILKVKLVIHFHGGDGLQQPGRSNFIHFIKNKINQKAIDLAAVIVLPSTSYLNQLNKEYILDKLKIFISPSGGVSLKQFAYKKRFYSRHKLLFVGRMVDVKRPLFLARCLKQLLNNSEIKFKVTIVGSGPLENKLKENLSEYDFEFIPSVSQNELYDIYKEHDMLIQTSSSESLGLVPLEFMATGGIPICSFIPAFSEYIDDGVNGYLFQSELEFANKVAIFFGLDEVTRNAMSGSACKTVELTYESQIVAEKLYCELKKK
tara:strand:- start:2532 stop:3563 length:1032 start_codon:yes stop_codon:yes gene_type:complete